MKIVRKFKVANKTYRLKVFTFYNSYNPMWREPAHFTLSGEVTRFGFQKHSACITPRLESNMEKVKQHTKDFIEDFLEKIGANDKKLDKSTEATLESLVDEVLQEMFK